MKNPLDLWRAPLGPYRELNQLQTIMDRMLEDFIGPRSRVAATKEWAFNPTCEVTEDKAHYFLKFDLPGVSKEQVKIEIHDNQLVVTGERKEEKKEDSKRYHFSEVNYGNFMRTFTLPSNTDAEKVEAKYENGVLTVCLAKTENARTRQVSVK